MGIVTTLLTPIPFRRTCPEAVRERYRGARMPDLPPSNESQGRPLIDMNRNEFLTAVADESLTRVIILRQWEQPLDDTEPPWHVWVFIPDRDDSELATGHLLADEDATALCFDRLDDAYRYVRACGYRFGIRIEDQIVEPDDAEDA